jgi:RNA polymerase sigma-70 factor (sigma-E family)
VNVGGDHGLADARVDGAGAVPRVASRRAAADRAAADRVAARRAAAQQVPRARREARNGSAPPPDAGSPQNDGPADEAGVAALAPVDIGFREYVATRSRALLRTAYLLTGNVADAEDLVQAALAKTYLAWDRIEDRSALDGYVRRAIVNTHISWWRRRRVEEYPTEEIPDQAVADHAGTSDLQESMRRAVDRLPQRMRAAVVLRYYEDMTEAEVAEALGVSLGTVKSTVSRAVAKLRDDADLQLWP